MGLLGSISALKIDDCVWAEFIDDLTARPAWRARHPVIVRDSHRRNFDPRPQLGNRRKNGSTLGAIRHAIRRIFNITTGKNLSVRQQDRRPDSKIRVWSVRILHGTCRRFIQLLTHAAGQLHLLSWQDDPLLDHIHAWELGIVRHCKPSRDDVPSDLNGEIIKIHNHKGHKEPLRKRAPRALHYFVVH